MYPHWRVFLGRGAGYKYVIKRGIAEGAFPWIPWMMIWYIYLVGYNVIEMYICTKPTFFIPVQVSLDFPLARSSRANGIVGARTLYYDLPRPPSTQMGQEHQFHSADGSGNSPFDPNMGNHSLGTLACAPVWDPFPLRTFLIPHSIGLSGLPFICVVCCSLLGWCESYWCVFHPGEVFATTIGSKNLEFETGLVLSLGKKFLELLKCIRLVLHRVDNKVVTEVVDKGNKVFETFMSHSLDLTDVREDST